MDSLKTIRISSALFENSGPQIGGVHSALCEMKLKEISSKWPRMASFTVNVRLTDGTTDSEWLTLGTFYTDHRSTDKYGNLYITAFDSMLMLEQQWTDKVLDQIRQLDWPITARKAADLVSEATGVNIDASSSALDDETQFIGLDTTSTARDVLTSIAVGCGGNWMLTQEGNLRLVSLKRTVDANPAIADIAIADLTVVGTGENSDTAYLDKQVKNIEENEPLTAVTGVEITSPDGTVAFAGTRTGYVIKATCAFASSSIAALCLNHVEGYVYTPFEASAARIDPAAEIGDFAHIDQKLYPIIKADWTIAPHITANLSAPFEEEVDHEYSTMISESAKTLKKAADYTDRQVGTSIQQLENRITTEVLSSYVDDETFQAVIELISKTEEIQSGQYSAGEVDEALAAIQTKLEQTDSSFSAQILKIIENQNDLAAIKYYVRYEIINSVGTVIIGQTDSNTQVRITNDEISIWSGNNKISYWNQNQQVSPKELKVPLGGKLTINTVLIQPRRSGNVSFLWVGDN